MVLSWERWGGVTMCVWVYGVFHSVLVCVFYLEEGAVGLQGTGEVVRVGAAEAVAAAGGSGPLAKGAAQRQTPPQSELHVDQSSGLSLVHLAGPQGAVQVDLTHRDGPSTKLLVACQIRLGSFISPDSAGPRRSRLTHRSRSRFSSLAGPSVCPSPCWLQKQHLR